MLPLRVGSEYGLLIHFCFLRKPQDFHLPSTSDEECQMIKNEPWEQESQVKGSNIKGFIHTPEKEIETLYFP